MARRQHLTLSIALVVIVFLSISYLFSGSSDDDFTSPRTSFKSPADNAGASDATDGELDHLPGGILTGGSIAPKLENATAK